MKKAPAKKPAPVAQAKSAPAKSAPVKTPKGKDDNTVSFEAYANAEQILGRGRDSALRALIHAQLTAAQILQDSATEAMSYIAKS